jgi:tryptophan synthase alpha chain
MTDLEKYTHNLKDNHRKALVLFFSALYPDPEKFAQLLMAAQSAGADLLEIGLPFSDPVADGKYIQHSSEWVLKKGYRLADFIRFYKEVRKELHLPVVIMSYLNPVFQYGLERFADFMSEERIAGILFPDLPVEETRFIKDHFSRRHISLVQMAAPSTADLRLRRIAQASSGFIYLVSIYGVTGQESKIDDEVRKKIMELRNITDKPVYAGFGISTPAQAQTLARQVDGIILGSALIRFIKGKENKFRLEEVRDFIGELRSVL